ncbi:MAG: radical SAM protein [Planctomycetes bacterium]|nr:radical SAM protein [Planctomycetota bacterium]
MMSRLRKILWQLRCKFFHPRPHRVILEPTNRCNLNCPFCMVGMQNKLVEKHGNAAHNLMSRPMGTMDEETFATVRKNLLAFGVNHVLLHFQGEPMLNTLTPSFARRLKEDGMTVGVFTNGQAFNDQNIADLAEAELDLIRFSVDGAAEDSYRQNRVGGTFAKVFENMQKVVAAHQGKHTRIEWQFLALRNNEHEIEQAEKLAAEIGINFFVKKFRETDPELAPENPAYRSQAFTKPCTDIYVQLGIYWNGDVVPCCYDVDGAEIMGNLLESDLQSIWNSEKYRDFRRRVDQYQQHPENDPCICETCLRWS